MPNGMPLAKYPKGTSHGKTTEKSHRGTTLCIVRCYKCHKRFLVSLVPYGYVGRIRCPSCHRRVWLIETGGHMPALVPGGPGAIRA